MEPTPLLNFVDMLVECCELGEFELVKQMALQDYESQLRRDPVLTDKVNAVCEKYFN